MEYELSDRFVLGDIEKEAIAHFSKADFWYGDRISCQSDNRVYHNHFLNFIIEFGSRSHVWGWAIALVFAESSSAIAHPML